RSAAGPRSAGAPPAAPPAGAGTGPAPAAPNAPADRPAAATPTTTGEYGQTGGTRPAAPTATTTRTRSPAPGPDAAAGAAAAAGTGPGTAAGGCAGQNTTAACRPPARRRSAGRNTARNASPGTPVAQGLNVAAQRGPGR